MEQLAERRMQREEEAAADVEDSEEDSEEEEGSDVDDGEDGEGGSEDEEDEEDEEEEVCIFLYFQNPFLCCASGQGGKVPFQASALWWMTGEKYSHSSFQLFLVLSEITVMLTAPVSFLPLPRRFLTCPQHQHFIWWFECNMHDGFLSYRVFICQISITPSMCISWVALP